MPILPDVAQVYAATAPNGGSPSRRPAPGCPRSRTQPAHPNSKRHVHNRASPNATRTPRISRELGKHLVASIHRPRACRRSPPVSGCAVGVRCVAADAGPVPAGVGLKVQRPELVHADHHHRDSPGSGSVLASAMSSAAPGSGSSSLRGPGRWTASHGLHDLKRHALGAVQTAQAFMADVVDHPLSDADARSQRCAKDHVPRTAARNQTNESPKATRRSPAMLALSRRSKRRRTVGASAGRTGRIQRPEPVLSVAEIVDPSRTRSLGVPERERGNVHV